VPDINAVFTPQQRLSAKSLAEDPAFIHACNNLTETYFKLWQNAGTTEERERLWTMANVLHDVRAEVVYVRDHNKIDEARIKAAATRKVK